MELDSNCLDSDLGTMIDSERLRRMWEDGSVILDQGALPADGEGNNVMMQLQLQRRDDINITTHTHTAAAEFIKDLDFCFEESAVIPNNPNPLVTNYNASNEFQFQFQFA